MKKLLAQLFYKCYMIEMITVDRKLSHYRFRRGFTWDVITKATKDAEEKSKIEEKQWTVNNIKRIY